MEALWVIIKIFILQIIVAAIVVVILKNVLNRMLIESAINQLEILKVQEISDGLSEVTVMTHKKIKELDYNKIALSLYRRLHKRIDVVNQISPEIKGGMIIKIKSITIDYSLKKKLKESGLFGSSK